MKRRLIILLLLLATPVLAEDLYIADAAAGLGDGSSCANALAKTFFNTAANWGAGAGKISAGDTVHVCSTITCSSISTNGLTTQAAGTSGNVITVKLETGAVMSCGVWGANDGTAATGGAITINHDYITVDGGTNGIIKNTANGEGLANSVVTAAVTFSGGNVEIKNLTIQDMWVKTAYSSTVLGNMNGIRGLNSSHANILIHNNTLTNGSDLIAILYTPSGNSNWQVYNNNISKSCSGIVFASNGANATLDNAQVYGNEIYDGYVWWDAPDACHINGMHLFAAQSSTSITNLKVYSNYIHGNMSGGCPTSPCSSHVTGFIFIEGTGGGTIPSPLIYNNLLVTTTAGDGASNGFITCVTCTSAGIYNNTLIGQSAINTGISLNTSTGSTLKNNIVDTFSVYVDAQTITAADYNLYRNGTNWKYGGSFKTQAEWTALGWDANGLFGTNPALDGSYDAGATTPNGTSVSSVFTTDRHGTGRSNWTVGQDEYVAAGSAVSTSPASLTFNPQASGGTGTTLQMTLTNTGDASLTITSIAADNDFSAASDCGASLAASASCTITVTFIAKAPGSRTGTLTLTTNAASSPDTRSLSGTGVAQALLRGVTITGGVKIP